jgi:phenylpropionate dioxygenase-like ring-hydroxylating dioxygenase large terminal subunit
VCRADQIAEPGDRFGLTLLGEPVVAVRGADGEVRVLSNVCRHRGATIVDEGAGHGATLVCPYHRWAYRVDGSFVGAPLGGVTDVHDLCLTSVRHVVWEGFVLVNLTGDALDPASALSGLSAAIAPWRWDEMVTMGARHFRSTWNWKIMVENFSECYHHLGTHRASLEPFQPARTTKLIDNGGAPWAAMTVDTIEHFPADPDEWVPGFPVERSRDLSVWTAFPLLLAGGNARTAFWVHLVPEDTVHHRITWYLLAPRSQRSRYSTDDIERHLDEFAVVHHEDMESCARVQAGLSSGHLDRFRLHPLEAPVADFQRWVSSLMKPTADEASRPEP